MSPHSQTCDRDLCTEQAVTFTDEGGFCCLDHAPLGAQVQR